MIDNFGKPLIKNQTKEKEGSEKKVVWNEESVKKVKQMLNDGFEPKDSPFHEKDTNWRKGGIVYEYSEWEKAEIKKCKGDILYFANKYCYLMTDNGYTNISLRDYQRDMLNNFQNYRKNITLSSRQIGKCISYNSLITIRIANIEHEISIGELFKRAGGDINIYSLERDKIIQTIPLDEIEVLTDTGFKPATHIHLTKTFERYNIVLESGKNLHCADEHILFRHNLNEVYVKDLGVRDLIITKDGFERIIEIYKTDCSERMFDITVDSEDHRFYTNGILSHNTTTTTIFMAWFLCFHYDKNAMFLANKNDTVLEIVDKTKKVIQYLPFFLKPGIINKTQRGLVFDNGSRLKSQATSDKAAIGDTIHLLYIDEFAHIDEGFVKDFWENVYPTLSSSKISRIILTSTPNGRNLFWTIYKGAIEKLNGFKPYKVEWWKVPGREGIWKEQEIAAFGGGEVGLEAFNQQYGCQFLSASDLLLSESQLRFLEKQKKDYVHHTFDELDEFEINYSNVRFHPDYEIEDRKDDRMILSIDSSEGTGGDYSILNLFKVDLKPNWKKFKNKKHVNSIYDFFCLKQFGLFRSNHTEIGEFAKIIYFMITKILNPEHLKVVLEWNTYGSDLLNRLFSMFDDDNEMDDAYFIKYLHTGSSTSKKVGVKLRLDNKPLFCVKFKECVDNKSIIINETHSLEEAGGFGKNKKGLYEGQYGHDDIMMSSINAATALDTAEYRDMVEDYIDALPEEVQKKIYEILEKDVDELNDDIYDSLNDERDDDMGDDIFGEEEKEGSDDNDIF